MDGPYEYIYRYTYICIYKNIFVLLPIPLFIYSLNMGISLSRKKRYNLKPHKYKPIYYNTINYTQLIIMVCPTSRN